jgi:DNA-directed RNA polymerase specialized sigma24 family protein
MEEHMSSNETEEVKEVVQESVMHYVRNKDLIPEIEKFAETERISEELGAMLLLIAKNLSNKGNFINYTWKEDMIQEAVLTCCKYLKNFDLKKSNNPFSYITTICNHAFVNYINKQKKHSEIKDRCFNEREQVTNNEFGFTHKAIDYTVMAVDNKKKKKSKS